jgi:hypothetical protein
MPDRGRGTIGELRPLVKIDLDTARVVGAYGLSGSFLLALFCQERNRCIPWPDSEATRGMGTYGTAIFLSTTDPEQQLSRERQERQVN